MFSEEIKAFKRLGFRHVISPLNDSKLLDAEAATAGATSTTELRVGPRVWLDDLERTRAFDKYGITDSCCFEVCLFSCAIIIGVVTDRPSVVPWSQHSTVATFFS